MRLVVVTEVLRLTVVAHLFVLVFFFLDFGVVLVMVLTKGYFPCLFVRVQSPIQFGQNLANAIPRKGAFLLFTASFY